jgi:hypothetical protein
MAALTVYLGHYGPYSSPRHDDEIAVQTWDRPARRECPTLSPRGCPAMANSDAHNPGQVIGLPHNVVRAGQLELDAPLSGIRTWRTTPLLAAYVRAEVRKPMPAGAR